MTGRRLVTRFTRPPGRVGCPNVSPAAPVAPFAGGPPPGHRHLSAPIERREERPMVRNGRPGIRTRLVVMALIATLALWGATAPAALAAGARAHRRRPG